MLTYKLLSRLIGVVRWLVGMIFFGLAIIGFIFPIIPGWPFIVPAILLLGQRDSTLRHSHLLLRRGLRRLRRSPNPRMRGIGQRLSSEYVRSKRMLVPTISAAERMLKLSPR